MNGTNETGPCYVCRCEEFTAEELRAVIREGNVTVNDVKRRTRAAMGICQGIYCVDVIARLIAEETGRPVEQLVPITARPPVRVMPLGLLAETEE